jgi:hypothetical protein
MREIRLYRKIYCISVKDSEQTYTLINPFFLGANTFKAGTSNSQIPGEIETGLQITQESLGIFYVDLNPTLYSSDVTYDLVWYIKYTQSAPVKKLATRFRIGINSISGEITLEIVSNNIDIEIEDNAIELLISSEDLDFNIDNNNIDLDSSDNNLEIDIL